MFEFSLEIEDEPLKIGDDEVFSRLSKEIKDLISEQGLRRLVRRYAAYLKEERGLEEKVFTKAMDDIVYIAYEIGEEEIVEPLERDIEDVWSRLFGQLGEDCPDIEQLKNSS